MSRLIIPENYTATLTLQQTEIAIKVIKDFFLASLSTELRLRRVTAPLFVLKGLGMNDDLSGTELPVTFPIADMDGAEAEVVHSLAKWKRVTLADYEVKCGYGIITDMNAIRADEELDNLHSLYVDQWDWERVMSSEERTIDYLKSTVEHIYNAILRTEYHICETYPQIESFLPEKVTFIHSEELLQRYPNLTPKEREDAICKEYGAVFIIGIGCELSNGEKHDNRAPDYDDYTTVSEGTAGQKVYTFDFDQVMDALEYVYDWATDNAEKSLAEVLYTELADDIADFYPEAKSWDDLIAALKKEYTPNMKIGEALDRIVSILEKRGVVSNCLNWLSCRK